MSAFDAPIPAELAVDDEPLSSSDLARMFDAAQQLADDASMDYSAAVELLRGEFDPQHAAARWRVEDDGAAEWALRKLALARAERERLLAQAEEWQQRIDYWFQQAAREHERTAAFMEDRLLDYGLRRRAAGGKATLSLPSGAIKTSSSSATAEVDDDELLARALDAALADPPTDADEQTWARFRAWRDAWAELTADADEPVELVKLTRKVYVGPLRKLVHVAEQPAGWQVTVTLSCDHSVSSYSESDPADDDSVPVVGEFVVCMSCPVDPIDGPPQLPVRSVDVEQLYEQVVLGPDDQPVPGASVRAASVTAKVVLS